MALQNTTSEVTYQEDPEIHILHRPERFLGPLAELKTKSITVRKLKALGVVKNNDEEVRKERRDLLALVLRVLNDVSERYKEDNDIFNEESWQESGEEWVCTKLSPLFQIHFLRRTCAPSLLLDHKTRLMMQEELEELSEGEIQRLERCAERQRQYYITKCKERYKEIFTTDRAHPVRNIDFITRCLIDFIMVPLKDERIGEDNEYVEEDYYIYMHAIRALAPYLNTCSKSEVRRFLQICNVQWVRKNCYTHEIQCVVKYWLMDRDYGVTLAHILGEMFADSSSYFDDYMMEHIVDYIVARKYRTLFNFREIRNLMVFYMCAALIHSPNDFYNTIILENLMKMDGHESWHIAEVIYREGLIDWTWNGKFWLDYLEYFELPVGDTEDILLNQCPRVMVGGRDTGSVARKVSRAQERYDARVERLRRRNNRNMKDPSYCDQLEKKRRAAEKMKARALMWLKENFPVEDGEYPEEKQWVLVSQKQDWKAAGCPPSGEDLILKVYRETNCDKILIDGATRERKYEVYGPAPPLKPLSLMREPLDLDEDCVTDSQIARFGNKSIWKRADHNVESIREALKEEGTMVIIKEGSDDEEEERRACKEELGFSERDMKQDWRDGAARANWKETGAEGTGKESGKEELVQAMKNMKQDGAVGLNWKEAGAEGGAESGKEELGNALKNMMQDRRNDTAGLNERESTTEGRAKLGEGDAEHGENNMKKDQRGDSTKVNGKESCATERGRGPRKEEVDHTEKNLEQDVAPKFSYKIHVHAAEERERTVIVKEKTERSKKASKKSKMKKGGASEEEREKHVEKEAGNATPNVWDSLRTTKGSGQNRGLGAVDWEGPLVVVHKDPSEPAWEGGPSTKQLVQLLGDTLNSKNLKHTSFAGMDPEERNEMIRREAVHFICGYCKRVPDYLEKFGKCASCRRAHYCSKECQRKHWREGHKEECPKLLQHR
ncbi:Hypp2499 [Branchiostoma lanceolatum]|uniref:Hypp2499 protein n=1 Tax=Branchiostoma lanceolatum TaxID=7740 RepID=A0A8J9ZU18_BRALA|nr:Hypp2499 [Branchiostoma lanceolatum]